MNPSSPSTLEEAIRHAGQGWLIDSFVPPQDALSQIVATLQSVQQEARRRLGDGAPDFSEASLVRAYRSNPYRVCAFFQALGGRRTPQMLLMVWRILQGMEVSEITLRYRRQESFEVTVILESPCGEKDEPYVSHDVHDFALLRHMGILEIAGTPVLQGFYARRRDR